MTRILIPLRRHPLSAFYLLAFGLSWGAVLLAAGGLSGLPADAEELSRLLPAVVSAMVVGPLIAGPLLTALTSGRTGFRELGIRLRAWRVHPGWYAVALLAAPAMVLAAALPLSTWSASFLPSLFTATDATSIVTSGLIAGLAAGLCEETGWTAFAVPRLLSRHGILVTGLTAGLLWGLWHVGVAYWGAGTADGQLSPLILANQLAFYFGVLPAYRILMVWVFARTDSLLLAMIMHGSLTAFTTFILTSPVDDLQRLVLHLTEAGLCWAAVAGAAAFGAFGSPSGHEHGRLRVAGARAAP